MSVIYYNIIWNKTFKCFGMKESKRKLKRAYYVTSDKEDAESFLAELTQD